MRKPKTRPFARILNVAVCRGIISYLHPTKGWRHRTPTPQLMNALVAAS